MTTSPHPLNATVALTTATPYASAALTVDPAVIVAIKQNAHAFLRSNQPMTAVAQAPIECLTCPSVTALFDALSNKTANLIICAIENSEVGSFRSVYELVVSHSAFIVGEFALKSTSSPDDGAQTIWTRYVFVALREYPSIQFAPRVALKASLVLGLSHEAGSIFRILSCFAMRNINVLKFEMRAAHPYSFDRSSPFSGGVTRADVEAAATSSPFLSSRSVNWAYLFYVDYALSPSDQVNAALLASLKEFSITLVQIGTYQQNLTADDDHNERLMETSSLTQA